MEIEESVVRRVESIGDALETVDPEYSQGLRRAISAAIELGLEGIERRDFTTLPMPIALLSQAKLAARKGTDLDTVLRRYLAGYAELDRFLSEEAHRSELLDGRELSELRRGQTALFERLVQEVSTSTTAKRTGVRSRRSSVERRR